MNKLNKMTLTVLLATGFIAGTLLTTQAEESLISSKDAVLSTVIATPGQATVSGQPINAAAYSSKITPSGAKVTQPSTSVTRPKVSGQPVDALAYSSKAR